MPKQLCGERPSSHISFRRRLTALSLTLASFSFSCEKPKEAPEKAPPPPKTFTLPGPVMTLALDHPVVQKLEVVPFEAFHPKGSSDHAKLPLGLTADRGVLNLLATMALDDPDTPRHEGFQELSDHLRKEYLPKHAPTLTRLGITDASQLTPRQAVELAVAITIERLSYSKSQAADRPHALGSSETQINDKSTIVDIFSAGEDSNGNAVCRNYTTVAQGVLEALKLLQRDGQSRIANTFLLNLSSVSFGQGVAGEVADHAWSGVLCFEGERIVCSVLDPTWADSSGGADPAQRGLANRELDHTSQRLFTIIERAERAALLPAGSFTAQLLSWLEKAPDTSYPPPSEDNIVDLVRAVPMRVLAAERLMEVLQAEPVLERIQGERISRYLPRAASDLSEHVAFSSKLKPYLRQSGYEDLLLRPNLVRLEKMALVARAVGSEGAKAKISSAFDALLPDAIAGELGTAVAALRVAEALEDGPKADKLLTEALSPYLSPSVPREHREVVDSILRRYHEDLKPERQAHWRGLLKSLVRFAPAGGADSAAWELKTVHGMRLLPSYSLPADKKEKLIHELRLASDRLRTESLPRIIVLEPSGRAAGPERIVIAGGMRADEIESLLRASIEMRSRIGRIKRECPALLEIDNLEFQEEPDRRVEVLANMARYFCREGRRDLLRFKTIGIGRSTFSLDPSHIVLSAELFGETYQAQDVDREIAQKTRLSERDLQERARIGLLRTAQRLEQIAGIEEVRIQSAINISPAVEKFQQLFENLPAEDRVKLQFARKLRVKFSSTQDEFEALDGERGKAVFKNGVPLRFFAALSYQGRQLLSSPLLGQDGCTVAAERFPASLFLGDPGPLRVVHEGTEFEWTASGGKGEFRAHDGRRIGELRKGDRVLFGASPSVYLDNSGESVVILSDLFLKESGGEFLGAIRRYNSAGALFSALESRGPSVEYYSPGVCFTDTDFKRLEAFLSALPENNALIRNGAALRIGPDRYSLRLLMAISETRVEMSLANELGDLGRFLAQVELLDAAEESLFKAKAGSISGSFIELRVTEIDGTRNVISLSNVASSIDRLGERIKSEGLGGFKVKFIGTSYADWKGNGAVEIDRESRTITLSLPGK